MSVPSELGHVAMPINFKTRWYKRVSNPGPFDPVSYALPLRYYQALPHWQGLVIIKKIRNPIAMPDLTSFE